MTINGMNNRKALPSGELECLKGKDTPTWQAFEKESQSNESVTDGIRSPGDLDCN
jgi:hypothetical protein